MMITGALAKLGSTMRNPDVLLTVVAIRLAALVVAGLVVRTLPDPPHQDVACFSAQAVAVNLQKPEVATPGADESADVTLREMRLHD
jgi:hypothetical protein